MCACSGVPRNELCLLSPYGLLQVLWCKQAFLTNSLDSVRLFDRAKRLIVLVGWRQFCPQSLPVPRYQFQNGSFKLIMAFG